MILSNEYLQDLFHRTQIDDLKTQNQYLRQALIERGVDPDLLLKALAARRPTSQRYKPK